MKLWMISTVAAAALLAACGGKDDAPGVAGDTAAVEVGNVTLSEVQLRAGDAAQTDAVLGAMALSQSGAGRVSFADSNVSGADATFSNVEIIMGDDYTSNDGAARILAGTLSVRGMDMTDGAASFAQIRLDDITVQPEEGDDDALLKIADMQISNPSPALAAWVATLLSEEEPGEFPSGAELSFDALSLNNLVAEPDEGDELDTFQIERIDFRDLSETGLGAMVIKGASLSATDEVDGGVANFSLGSLSVVGVGEVIAKSIAGEFSGGAEELPLEVLNLLAANPGDPGYDSIHLDDLIVDMAGVSVDLPSYYGDVTRDAEGRAVRNQLAPFEMTVGADPTGEIGGQLAGQLGLLGYESLVIRGAADSKIDHGSDLIAADADANYLELEDGFRLSFGGEFEGLSAFYSQLAQGDLESLETDPGAIQSSLASLGLHGLEISFDDNSFVDRAFSAAAAMNGGTADELKDQAKLSLGLAPLLASSSGFDADIVTEFTNALGSFISKPGKLTLSLAPDNAITMDMLEDPTALTKDVLGFSATAQ